MGISVMLINGRKTVALMVCGMSGTFQQEFGNYCQTIAKAAGYNLLIFASFVGYETNKDYLKGEMNIVKLPPYEDFDGIIVVPDTYQYGELRNRVLYTVNSRCNCPVVSVRSTEENMYSINTDNSSAMAGIIKHFIEVHGKRKIAYLSGTKDHPDAIARLNSYLKVMADYDIPVTDDMMYHGNFWNDRGKEYFEYFFGGDRSTWPEVVVCANDHMAEALLEECFDHGVRVPQDVLVSGFDDLTIAENCMPPLTTVKVSARRMAEAAFDVIIKVNNGEEAPKVQYIETENVIRSSCGCKELDIFNMFESIKKIKRENDYIYDSIYRNTYMSVQLEKLEEYDKIGEHINFLKNGEHTLKNLYICLCENDNKGRKVIEPIKNGYSDDMRCIYAIRNKEIKDINEAISFPTRQLVPDIAFENDEPVSYFFTALHFLDNTYGYIIHSYEDERCYTKTFHNWCVMISNAIENVHSRTELNALVDRLNDLYIREPMTGLYNRRGFEQQSKIVYDKAVKNKKTFTLIEVDMDNLKKINDNYGHAEGDVAIEAIADTFKSIAVNGEICARVGGDEFWVIVYDYSNEQLKQFIDAFYDKLDKYNKTEQRPYDISMSYGAHRCNPANGCSLDVFLNIVDAKMYDNKTERKKNIVIRGMED